MGYSMEGGGGMGDKVAEATVGRMSHVGHFRREKLHLLYCILWGRGDRGLHWMSWQRTEL